MILLKFGNLAGFIVLKCQYRAKFSPISYDVLNFRKDCNLVQFEGTKSVPKALNTEVLQVFKHEFINKIGKNDLCKRGICKNF